MSNSSFLRSARQPATTTEPTRPCRFSSSISRMTARDSWRAASMKPQVLTTTTSAPSASGTRARPSWASLPSIRSESTVFFGQPRLTKAKVGFSDINTFAYPLRMMSSGSGAVVTLRGRGLQVRDRLDLPQGRRSPLVEHVRTLTDGRENDEGYQGDAHHLRVANLVSPATGHPDAEWAERFRLEVVQNFLWCHEVSARQ